MDVSTTTLVHVGTELVIAAGLSIWFHKRIANANVKVDELAEKVAELEKIIMEQNRVLMQHEQVLRQLLGHSGPSSASAPTPATAPSPTPAAPTAPTPAVPTVSEKLVPVSRSSQAGSSGNESESDVPTDVLDNMISEELKDMSTSGNGSKKRFLRDGPRK